MDTSTFMILRGPILTTAGVTTIVIERWLEGADHARM